MTLSLAWGRMSPKLLVALLSSLCYHTVKAKNLHVYDPFPGLYRSPNYDIRIREKGEDHWIKTFPMILITECTDAKNCGFGGIADHLKNWSNTFVNFEMKEGVDIEVKITMLFVTKPYQKL